MVNFLLHNCLIQWFWSFSCCQLPLASRPQHSPGSPFCFYVLSVCFCLLLWCLTLKSWHPQGPAFNYLPSCTSRVISSKSLTSIPTCIHGSITYVIVIAYNTLMEQLLLYARHFARWCICLVSFRPHQLIIWVLLSSFSNEEFNAQKVSKSCPIPQN